MLYDLRRFSGGVSHRLETRFPSISNSNLTISRTSLDFVLQSLVDSLVCNLCMLAAGGFALAEGGLSLAAVET